MRRPAAITFLFVRRPLALVLMIIRAQVTFLQWFALIVNNLMHDSYRGSYYQYQHKFIPYNGFST